jgi:hypothetical protein
MKKILIITLIISFLLNALLIAEEDVEKDDASKEEKTINKENGETVLEEFVPSEEISIDKPVAFPVDI